MDTVNYQCPSCRGPLRFDSETGVLQCDYCGSSFTAQQVEAFYAAKQETADGKAQSQNTQATHEGTIEGAQEKAAASKTNPVEDYVNRAEWNTDEHEGMQSYNCSSCGAQLMVDSTTAVTSCPYCGNPTVMPGTLSDVVKPDLVIPFKVSKEEAIQKLTEYYAGKPLLPKGFADKNKLEHIQGVYVPFWLYDAQAQGSATFAATKSRTFTTGRETVREEDHYEVYRAGDVSFDRVPVDASSKMPDAHMDAIEPYDYSGLESFSTGYLPGYLAERYDLDANACWDRAESRTKQSTVDALRSTVGGYETVSATNSNINVHQEKASYALLPVWMLHTKSDGKDYLFAVNGQQGKIAGDLPVSSSRSFGYFMMAFVATVALSWVSMGMLFGNSMGLGNMVFALVIGIVVAALILNSLKAQMKTAVEKHEASSYLEPGGINLTQQSDRFVNTTRTVIQKQDAGGRGSAGRPAGGHGGRGPGGGFGGPGHGGFGRPGGPGRGGFGGPGGGHHH